MLIIIVTIFLLLFIASQISYVLLNGSAVPRPVIPRTTETLGSGVPLSFVVIGDSTSIGQGGSSYDKSIAKLSAYYLAKKYTVSLTNVGVSGATTKDALNSQVDSAITHAPDIVLIALGANDVTHLVPLNQIEHNLTAIITALQAANPAVHIILTGSPDMGAVPRFPWPLKICASWRTKRINSRVQHVADMTGCQRVHIAELTGPLFRKSPQLFAQDRFHPLDEGYAVWMPYIYTALDAIT